MYVIFGATGNIGTEIVHRLLAKGEKVRAVGRNPEKLRALAAKGSETVSADLHDTNALTNALAGARAVHVTRRGHEGRGAVGGGEPQLRGTTKKLSDLGRTAWK